MRPTNNYFMQLAGVPVHYARAPLAPYGTKGVEYRFFVDKAFEQILHDAFGELFQRAGLKEPQVITSAGTYVNKSGFHGLARAFDLDAIFWKDKEFITLNYPNDRVFYLGVEAILRKHFGTVLNYNYNRAHHDHLHVDDGSEVGFTTTSRSRVLFVQDAIKHVLDIPLSVDGVYGPQTERSIRLGLEASGITGVLTTKEIWLAFLTLVADKAFATERAKLDAQRSPQELLSHLLDLVDTHLQDHAHKKDIEAAINALVEHEDIKKCMDDQEEDS